MSKSERIKSKLFIVLVLMYIIAVACSAFAIYEIWLLESIETTFRYIIIGVLAFLDGIFFIKLCNSKYLKKKKNGKVKSNVPFLLLLFIYALFCFAFGGTIYYVYGKIDSLNKVYVTYSSSLITMNSSDVNKISDVKDKKIAILKDTKSPEGYIIPMEIVDENKLEDDNELVDYDDYSTMLSDLYAKDIDLIFISSSYVDMFSNVTGYEEIKTDTKVITSKEKKMKKVETSESEGASSGKDVTEPFTILLMGIDSTDEVLSKNAIANGDTLILITFNPKTLNATMLSIPRDSYVPIACWGDKAENKITHAAGYGTDCMMNTIEDYFDVNIDYYAKINFKGLVKLVDALGGVEIDVDQRLCTDNSNREYEVCVEPGKQVLDGEHALVYARNRKALKNGDFGRGQHQQELVKAMINKMKTVKNVSTFMEILNTISNSMDTNLTTKQILSFYNVGKDIIKKSVSSDNSELVNIQQLYLQGNGQMIYDEKMRMVLYDYVPNKDSRDDIKQAMNENLELAKHEDITEFSFSINEPYEKKVIGEGPYKTSYMYTLVPNFKGDSMETARASASKLGLTASFVGDGGSVVSQDMPEGKRVDKVPGKRITFTLSGKPKPVVKEDDKKTTTDDDKNSSGTNTGGNTGGSTDSNITENDE